jgi:hypothetical protein
MLVLKIIVPYLVGKDVKTNAVTYNHTTIQPYIPQRLSQLHAASYSMYEFTNSPANTKVPMKLQH